MKRVLVVGTEERLEEFKELNLQNADITYADPSMVHAPDPETEEFFDELLDDEFYNEDEVISMLSEAEDAEEVEEDDDIEIIETADFDIVFDLNLDEDPESFETYLLNEGQVVIGSAVLSTLSSTSGMWGDLQSCVLIGMNAFPSFINRPKLELSLLNKADLMTLESTMKVLGLEYELVADEIGMVTPRIISMIINEACFVLGEGTAEIEAVDQAMRLGTNYPKGPFKWADEIGIENVYNLLETLLAVTGDGKYKIAPRLRKHHELYAPFYQ